MANRLEKILRSALQKRFNEGVKHYRLFHGPGPVYPLEEIWTEAEDWNEMVVPHKRNFAIFQKIISRLQEYIEEGVSFKHIVNHIDSMIDAVVLEIIKVEKCPSFNLQAITYSREKTIDGVLIRALEAPWRMIVEAIIQNRDTVFQISPRKWEELIAASFDKAGYDEVTLTPRSGDQGRDVIAVRRGVGSVRILGSVKIYSKDRLVRYDDIRALAGVLLGDLKATKGIVMTTSDFPPQLAKDPGLQSLIPFRMELMNGDNLVEWLKCLAEPIRS